MVCERDNELGQGLTEAGTLVGAYVFFSVMHCSAPRGQHRFCLVLVCPVLRTAGVEQQTLELAA